MQAVISQVLLLPETGIASSPWEEITTVSTAVQAVVTATLLVGVFFGYRQYKDSRLAQQILLLQDQQDKYRSARIHGVRNLLSDQGELRRKLLNSDSLTADEREQLNDLLSFFEFLGALVRFGALDFRQVEAVFPTAPRKYWHITEPYGLRRRKAEPNYLESYEMLVRRYHAHTQQPLE
jgi:hypothetical protein